MMSSAAVLLKTFRASGKAFRDRAKTVRLPAGIIVRVQPGIVFVFTLESAPWPSSGFTKRFMDWHERRPSRSPGYPEWQLSRSRFDTERLTGALLDRLTHHVHILEMNGDSYRLKDSKQRQPSKPRS
jgi:hypothetical protein